MSNLITLPNDECPDGTMDYIVDMLGTGLRDKMMETMGGTTICIPSSVRVLTDDHKLVRGLGRIDAEELVDTVPAAIFYVPKSNAAVSTKDRAILMMKAGASIPTVARALNISDRTVGRYRASAGMTKQYRPSRSGSAHRAPALASG